MPHDHSHGHGPCDHHPHDKVKNSSPKGEAVTDKGHREVVDHSHGHGHSHNKSCDHHDTVETSPPKGVVDHSHGHGHSHSKSCDHHDTVETSPPKGEAATDKERRDVVPRKLKMASLLCLTFFVVEVVGGILAGSLAVLSDAAHLAADLSAFIVAIAGSHIASLPASNSHTFGLRRTESLAALFSMVSLAIISFGLAMEAIRRIWVIFYGGGEITEVDGKLMSTIAAIGVVVNVILAYVLGENHVHMVGSDNCDHDHENRDGHSHSHHNHDEESALLSKPHAKERNVNLQAAYLHVLADLLQSVVVFVAGLIIWAKPAWHLVDPICTLVFSILVGYSTVNVIRSSLSVLLEGVPPGINWEEVHSAIKNVKGVSNVHDLHIWSISHDNAILSVHATADDTKQVLRDIMNVCNQRKISHVTVQLQPNTIGDCVTCTDGSVHQCR